ncbi:SgcJ/EcaC family oxidoreductase [Dyadobacter sp. NIV53]|uniref:SgcJ/EcaC family oxidoreductase n=1 Tax=Dyadobacter sp. NIV53 TaxID=2861765 RepID=UPI001C87B2BE|nr:SgcJ/EcaC family oxidoreductase [Dyadobacter sp. NIV53]
MKHLLLIYGLVLLPIPLFAQGHTNDEMAIKNVIRQQESAWNKHDWDEFSNHFTDDGTLINFIGQFWKDRNDITAHFKFLSDCCLAPTTLKFEFVSARFLTPDVVIVYLQETLIADKDYEVPFHNYKKGETDYKMVTNVFVKTNNEWKITAAQLTLINQIVSPHNSSGKQN